MDSEAGRFMREVQLTKLRKQLQDDDDLDDDDDNFENGGNQVEIEMRSDIDMIDKSRFENIVLDYANFNEHFANMSIKQKTSYFIINSVLMSICHSLIHANEEG